MYQHSVNFIFLKKLSLSLACPLHIGHSCHPENLLLSSSWGSLSSVLLPVAHVFLYLGRLPCFGTTHPQGASWKDACNVYFF